MKHTLQGFNKLNAFIISIIFVAALIPGISSACDIAVISGKYTANGRPVIWKNRDCSASAPQQIKYFQAEQGYDGGGYLMVYNFDDIANSVNSSDITDNHSIYYENEDSTYTNPSGGLNEAGFAIACTSVYEDYQPLHEMVNINTYLIWRALAECKTLVDFEALLQAWNDRYPGTVISGNFVVIDAEGGAALYECFTGSEDTPQPIKYRKSDADSGEVKRWRKNEETGVYESYNVGDGYLETTGTWLLDLIYLQYEEKDYEDDVIWQARFQDQGLHYWNLTNNNCFIAINYGDERKWRADDILSAMYTGDTDPATGVQYNGIDYFSIMRYVAKDVVSGNTDPAYTYNTDETAYSSTYCISRNATRLGLVVDGVADGDDPRLATFWCALGEPSVAVFIPYFAWGGNVTKFDRDCGVSPLAWADSLGLNNDGTQTYYDLNDNSMLARLSNRWELHRYGLDYGYNGDYATYTYTCMYKSNTGSVTSGMENRLMNKIALRQIQTWTLPIENTVVAYTETFLSTLRDNNSLITNENLRNFSDYCAEYVYKNMNEGSATAYTWEYGMPSASSVSADIVNFIMSIF